MLYPLEDCKIKIVIVLLIIANSLVLDQTPSNLASDQTQAVWHLDCTYSNKERKRKINKYEQMRKSADENIDDNQPFTLYFMNIYLMTPPPSNID